MVAVFIFVIFIYINKKLYIAATASVHDLTQQTINEQNSTHLLQNPATQHLPSSQQGGTTPNPAKDALGNSTEYGGSSYCRPAGCGGSGQRCLSSECSGGGGHHYNTKQSVLTGRGRTEGVVLLNARNGVLAHDNKRHDPRMNAGIQPSPNTDLSREQRLPKLEETRVNPTISGKLLLLVNKLFCIQQ